ncbi:MAG: hypothetical protein M0P14_01805, partial [Alkaliphilus sp.]|nr:hypothetical protein [Alkaliphilus sp.]
ATPRWDAGGCWVSDVNSNGFTLNFNKVSSEVSEADIIVTRAPFQQSIKRQRFIKDIDKDK